MELEKNAQGNIRANSFNNLNKIFSNDNELKNVLFVQQEDRFPVYAAYLPWNDKKITRINLHDLKEFKFYIDKKYHYVPNARSLQDFIRIRIDHDKAYYVIIYDEIHFKK